MAPASKMRQGLFFFFFSCQTVAAMRPQLATLPEDYRHLGNQIAVVRHQGLRRRVSSYAHIAQLAGRFAAFLEQQKIAPGERVLLWAANSAEWIAAFHGCILRGVLAVPLDVTGSADFAARVAADVRPRLAIGDAHLLDQLPTAPPLDFPRLSFEDWLDSLPSTEAGAVPGLGKTSPLQILFTSGTTGEPKGIVLTHGNVLSAIGPIEEGAQRYLRYERLVHPLRFLHTLPLSHVFGQMMGLWLPPIFAAEVHFEDRLVAGRLIETIHQEKISVLAAVPRVHALLKNHLETEMPALSAALFSAQELKVWRRWWRFRQIHRLFGLKFWALISGGGALSSEVEEFWSQLGFAVIQGYGMTESTALITLNHPFHIAHGTLGRPMPGRAVKFGPDGELLVRGAMVSPATWSNGSMRTRRDEWLSTGDLVARDESGALRFLGRKSETIVTAAGVNLHPEDLEAALEAQPGVAACAVLPQETPHGPEPFAVLAFRGAEEEAQQAIVQGNAHLSDFQQLRRWALWPDPDLPRTSTGKVRRAEVAAWMKRVQEAAASPDAARAAASTDWLVNLIAHISGEAAQGIGDELRLNEDLHLDSLGRVQLEAALEERLGGPHALPDHLQSLGELREFITQSSLPAINTQDTDSEPVAATQNLLTPATNSTENASTQEEKYPHWPWSLPIRWLRTAFLESCLRPLVRLLGTPRVVAAEDFVPNGPLLIVSNHVSAYDGALILYALPARLRRSLTIAMAAEMLAEYRRFRHPDNGSFLLFGPAIRLLLLALFNVFPLPRHRNFQHSFRHAGEAMDHGFSVLVFPEGTRSPDGSLARFRPGIGLLAKETGAQVLPIALRGVGEIKTGQLRWFRSGHLEIHIGAPLRFSATENESAITEKIHTSVSSLLLS